MISRRRAIAVGSAALVAYIALAALSARLDPLARHPLLDGIGPPPPYRWVKPPPALAKANQQPLPGRATLKMQAAGSNSGFVSTKDGQLTLIVGVATFPRDANRSAVLVTIQPEDPARLGRLPSGLAAAGNAYLIRAEYQPGGPQLHGASKAMTVSMIYPALATNGVTPPHHTILSSSDGRSWKTYRTNDTPAGQVAEAETTALGYFVVVLPRSALATSSSSGHSRVLLFVIIGIIVALLVGSALVIWSRRRAVPSAAKSPRRGTQPRQGKTSTRKRPRRR